jgi:hypothetical protein
VALSDPTVGRGRGRWLRAVILLAVVYLVIGVIFSTLAGSAGSQQLRVTWRLAAWLASAAAFAAHIGYEHSRLRSAPGKTAWHAATAVALGALALAVAANVHAQRAAAPNQRGLALALVLWPALCGVPAFVVALAAAAGLARMRRGD